MFVEKQTKHHYENVFETFIIGNATCTDWPRPDGRIGVCIMAFICNTLSGIVREENENTFEMQR